MRNYGARITKPKSVQAIENLENIGISFPLHYDSQVAEGLFLFYAMNLFSGHIDKLFLPAFHIPTSDHLESVQERLGQNLKQHDPETDYYTVMQAANPLGRILYLMGCPKERTGTSLPLDLSQMQYTVDHRYDLPQLSDIIVNELIFNKTKSQNTKSKLLRLRGHSIEKEAIRYAANIVALFETVFSGLGFDFDLTFRETTRQGNPADLYTPSIRLSYEKIRAMMSYNVLYPETLTVLGISE
jgi:hypothetical protein